MTNYISDIAFSPAVKEWQEKMDEGSRAPSLKDKLEITFPLIPGILKYKSE